MPPTAVFLLSSNQSASTLTSAVTSAFPSATPLQNKPFFFTHSIWRSVPTSSTQSGNSAVTAAQTQSHLQLLQSHNLPRDRTYVQITPPAASVTSSIESQSPSQTQSSDQSQTDSTQPSQNGTAFNVQPSSTVTIPTADSRAFAQLLSSRISAVWAPVRQLEVELRDARALDVGVFGVRVGEVWSRGVGAVHRLSLLVVDLDDGDGEEVQGEVDDRTKAMVKELLGMLKVEKSVLDEVWWPDESPSLWCEVLRRRVVATGVVARKAS